MKMDEYLEKKKELEEAEKKAEEIKRTLRAEKKQKVKENLDKINIFHKLKPWTRSDLILAILMIILFLVAYNHGGSVDNEDKQSFLSGVFGFFVKNHGNDETSLDSVSNLTYNEELDDGMVEDNADESVDIADEEDEEEVEKQEIDFDLYFEYEDQQFDIVNLTGKSNIIYYVILDNDEGFSIECEGYSYRNNEEGIYSKISVDPNDEKSLFTRIACENNSKVTVKHKFICYDEDVGIEGGTEKQKSVTIYFN